MDNYMFLSNTDYSRKLMLPMKRIVVLGAGESGTGAAILAKEKGFDVFVSDMGEIKPGYRAMLDYGVCCTVVRAPL